MDGFCFDVGDFGFEIFRWSGVRGLIGFLGVVSIGFEELLWWFSSGFIVKGFFK